MFSALFSTLLTLVLYSLLLFGCLLWGWFRWSQRHLISIASKLPCLDSTLPLLGHIHHTARSIEGITHWVLELSRNAMAKGFYTICLWLGPLPIIMVHDAEDIQKILNSSSTSEKGDEMQYTKYVLGDGLLTSSGSVWKITRRYINALFHNRNLQQLMPVFNRNSRELVSNLSQYADKSPVNVLDHTMDTALKTALNLVFGSDVEFDINSEGFRCLMKVVEMIPDIFTKRVIRLWLRIDAVFQFLYKKELEDITRHLKNFTDIPLKITRANNEQKRLERNLLDTKYKYDTKDYAVEDPLNFIDVYSMLQKNYPQFTEKELKSEIITLYCTGTDTVGLAAASCLLLLAQYPDIQERLYSEILSVVNSEGDITIQDLQRMTYLEQVYKETLRWSTIVPYILRKTMDDLKLSSCMIPAGNTIVVCLRGIHMDPKIYPNPHKFDPDRFSAQNTAKKQRYDFLPFSGGPRNCIGKNYTLLLMKVMVVHVLRKYKLSTNMDVNNMRRRIAVTLVSADGYNVFLEHRTQK